jgi:hypothetical protein
MFALKSRRPGRILGVQRTRRALVWSEKKKQMLQTYTVPVAVFFFSFLYALYEFLLDSNNFIVLRLVPSIHGSSTARNELQPKNMLADLWIQQLPLSWSLVREFLALVGTFCSATS